MALEVSARVAALIIEAAVAAGASAPALCAASGFDRGRVDDPDARVAMDLVDRLWEAAADATGDPSFGLRAALGLRPGMFDVVDYAVRTAPTLRVAIERLVRYDRLVRDAGALGLTVVGDRARLAHAQRPAAAPSRHAIECKLASLLVIARQLTGRPLVATAVSFRHPAPTDVALHARVFGVAPCFAAGDDALELDAAELDTPCPGADPALWRIVERHAEVLLAARPAPAQLTARVRHHLTAVLADGGATLVATAAHLRLSERSLQRRLAGEGATFEALLDELRRELASRYLGDRALAIGEVAYLLGYSEPSAFHRAFKRWTGTTPADARRRQPPTGSSSR
ncbi:MAG: AraC family transcriptional regulator [Kofleriaceae bacterium]|nr:AraC family transcriptional regulator [Kofleriaceae bacterium]MCL4223645.1 helix-turn-helix transcriptional regulator [Myxococcales bacterium]